MDASFIVFLIIVGVLAYSVYQHAESKKAGEKGDLWRLTTFR
jgi:hypothetical protein